MMIHVMLVVYVAIGTIILVVNEQKPKSLTHSTGRIPAKKRNLFGYYR
jgi:hypothetical protein